MTINDYYDIDMNKRVSTSFVFLFVFICTYAQLSTNESPISFSMGSKLIETKRSMTAITMPELNMSEIEKEDAEDEEDDNPPRFGFLHKVNYDLENSGIWYELPNGDKLWQLNVICPGALSINFCFDRFWLPEGGKFFIYSKDRKHSIGAFTNKNNKGDRDNIRGFATGLVYGNDVIIEYYQPKNVTSDAIISIEYVVHGYRYINIGSKMAQSGSCMVNINCEEGQDWQNEKYAIGMVIVNGNRVCTGSLINTTNLSQKPYFLTANHCISNYGDAVGNSNLDYFSFCWNYEEPGCSNVFTNPEYLTTSGATILANNSFSDFALLRLSEDPYELANYTPFYAGWDCSGLSGEPGVGIHHPLGTTKKISTVLSQPTSIIFPQSSSSNTNNHWAVSWKSTPNGHGTTNKGSSGSPLFNADHKVIGQLHGSTCFGCNNLYGESRYGKIDVSWNGNNNDSIQRRLSFWLDSLNIGIHKMAGLLLIPSTKLIVEDQQLYCNAHITSTGQLTIQNNVEFMGDCRIIIEPGGQLVIDGGRISNVELTLKPGSYLQVLNGGIIETRHGFEAPVGAMIDIENGQIL